MKLNRPKRRDDWRIICDCQQHARRERTLLRRSARLARRITSVVRGRVLTAIFGVPLAFGVLELPSEAMNVETERFSSARALFRTGDSSGSRVSSRALPVFTTPEVAESFLHPVAAPRTFEIVKEEFFRSHIPYGSIIYREARRHRLSPELVAAVVGAESDFRVRLVSRSNAQGLMQILPETGRLLGANDLFNPEENIRAGAKYLRYLHDRFGDTPLALAAYNAGEGNVVKWDGIPPFEETQTFLRRVNVRNNAYRRRIRTNYLSATGMARME